MSRIRLNPSAPKCKVFLVDDHPIVRQGLALFIEREPDLMVCGEAEDATSALQAIRESTGFCHFRHFAGWPRRFGAAEDAAGPTSELARTRFIDAR
jgi:hypothetical protein